MTTKKEPTKKQKKKNETSMSAYIEAQLKRLEETYREEKEQPIIQETVIFEDEAVYFPDFQLSPSSLLQSKRIPYNQIVCMAKDNMPPEIHFMLKEKKPVKVGEQQEMLLDREIVFVSAAIKEKLEKEFTRKGVKIVDRIGGAWDEMLLPHLYAEPRRQTNYQRLEKEFGIPETEAQSLQKEVGDSMEAFNWGSDLLDDVHLGLADLLTAKQVKDFVQVSSFGSLC